MVCLIVNPEPKRSMIFAINTLSISGDKHRVFPHEISPPLQMDLYLYSDTFHLQSSEFCGSIDLLEVCFHRLSEPELCKRYLKKMGFDPVFFNLLKYSINHNKNMFYSLISDQYTTHYYLRATSSICLQ